MDQDSRGSPQIWGKIFLHFDSRGLNMHGLPALLFTKGLSRDCISLYLLRNVNIYGPDLDKRGNV